MTRLLFTLTALLSFFIATPAFSAEFFKVTATEPLAGTNGNTISITLCLNGRGPLSCQNYNVAALSLTIKPVIHDHHYPDVGIRINTPGYTPTGCTSISNGFCLFAASRKDPASIVVAATNIAPLIVNTGPPGVDALNTAFVTMTVCVPGTKNCVVIDSVQVDTGSVGIRLIHKEVGNKSSLPPVISNGAAVAECYTYVSSSVWGSVKYADVTIAGETAHNVPIQIIGDKDTPYATVPGSCPGPITDTVVAFGAKGIVGVNNQKYDCGDTCTDSSPPYVPAYYSCGATDCTTGINIALNLQVPNPVTYFPVDNNGTILQLPSLPPEGKVSVTGSLIFGIGTAANNRLSSSGVVLPTDANGNFKTLYNNVLRDSYTDSGTNDFEFPNDGVTPIPVSGGYYDPAQPLSLQATMVARGDTPTNLVNFTIVSEARLANDITAALVASSNTTFVWGLSFFFGHSLFTAIDGADTIYGKGPYIAY